MHTRAGSETPARAAEVNADRAPVIAALTGIRAVAAFLVVIDHLKEPLLALFPALHAVAPLVLSGFMRVEIFFVLSGFILAYNYAGRVNTRASYRKFLWARFARIYPTYLVGTTLALIVLLLHAPMDGDHPFFTTYLTANLVANTLLLGAVPPFLVLDTPAWTLSCELVSYLAFPLLAGIALRRSPGRALAWAGLLVAFAIVALNLTAPPPPTPWVLSYQADWIRGMTEFFAGVLLWSWWRTKRRRSARWDAAAILSVAAAVSVIYTLDPASPLSVVALPFIALFIVSSASATGPVAWLLSTSVMQWGGRVSYSVFLSHLPIYLLVERFLPWEHVADADLPVRLGWLLIIAMWIGGVGVGLYYLVEKPSRRRLLAWYARRHPNTDRPGPPSAVHE